jgi:DNA primase
MIYHPSVLARVAARPDFQFMHRRYQQLFELMARMGEVDEASLMGQLTGEDAETFYEVLSSVNLPDDISDQEIDDLLTNFVKAAKGSQLQALQDKLVQAKQTGNRALELQLTLQIIAQKQQDGV